MARPRIRTMLFGAMFALGAAAPMCRAQSTEFRLDSSGKWEEVSVPKPGTDEGLIAEARRSLADDRPEDARDILDDWIAAHENTEHPLLPQALLLRGDARTALGSEHRALYDYEDLIKRFPASPEYITAIERELEIAICYVNGLRYKWLGLRIWGASDIGEETLIRVQERLPASRLAERAGIELADYYYRERDLKMAGEAYDLFIKNYPSSPYRMKAMERQVYSAIGQFKGPEYDAAPLVDAQVLIKRFSALYPAEAQQAGLDDALVVRLDESAAASMLDTARWYLKHDDPVSARYMLRRLVAKHRNTGAAEIGLQMMTERGWLIKPPPAATPPAPEEPRPREESPAPTSPSAPPSGPKPPAPSAREQRP